MITISLNGESKQITNQSLDHAMKNWQYTIGQCAVAINGEFIPRSQYPATLLNQDDQVDIVSAVGGG